MSESTSFVQLFVGLLLITTGVHASCPIELSAAIVVVREGDPASAGCRATENHLGMGWEATQGGVALQGNNTTNVTWAVQSLKEWDITPTCFINPHSSEQCSKDLTVVLYTFPENISIHSNNSSRMIEYENYTFTCDIHRVAPVQNLTVKWYKGDTVIHTDTFNSSTKHPVNHSVDLVFSPTKKDNGTSFRCEAHMDLRPEGPQLNISSEESFITVLYPPSLILGLEDSEVYSGASLQLKCSSTSNPQPTYSWDYRHADNVNEFIEDGVTHLLIHNATEYNMGNYTCRASNDVGNVSKTVRVTVKADLTMACPSTYTARENELHNLTCTVDSYLEYEVTWYKDDEEVKLPERLDRSDAGQYLVTASNKRSVVNFTLDIIVKYPPSPILELEDSEVYAGSNLSLKCSSTSNPRPTYSWDYRHADNVNEFIEDGVTRLLIHNATEYNMGNYTCRASNDVGNVSKTVRVTVKAAEQECDIKINPNPNAQGCCSSLNFTLYESPEIVSIHNLTKPALWSKGTDIQLRCDIVNITPVPNLTLLWHRGNVTIKNESVQVNCCQSENPTSCNISAARSPVNVSSTINVTLDKSYNGTEFRCETQLNLTLRHVSSPLRITVFYEPTINTEKLPGEIPVFRGYPEELVCEADGHPAPDIHWDSDKETHDGKLIVDEAGSYTCTANNTFGSTSHTVKVVLKEDYLPLIAGFVAVTVVAISIVFLCIYSIYYKNTKMRRYSLKNPNFSTQNGNVAHNGWDVQFPMSKLP